MAYETNQRPVGGAWHLERKNRHCAEYYQLSESTKIAMSLLVTASCTCELAHIATAIT